MKRELPAPTIFYRSVHYVIGPVLCRFKVSCRDFTYLALEGFERPLDKSERRRYFIHYYGCSVCRRFMRQIGAIHRAVEGANIELDTFSPDASYLNRLHSRLKGLDAADVQPADVQPNGEQPKNT